MAYVVDCQPMGSGQHGWQFGARLDRPGNFWGLEACPEDWTQLIDAEFSRSLPSGGKDDRRHAMNRLVHPSKSYAKRDQNLLIKIKSLACRDSSTIASRSCRAQREVGTRHH